MQEKLKATNTQKLTCTAHVSSKTANALMSRKDADRFKDLTIADARSDKHGMTAGRLASQQQKAVLLAAKDADGATIEESVRCI